MSDTNRENDPMDEFLSTLGDEPQETKVLRVPEVIPTIQDDAANTESNAGPDGQTPLEGSDAEAYAALKAKRAERRRKELEEKGQPADFATVLADIRQRDYQDTHRAIAPLKQADDAILVDTSDIGFDESFELLKRTILAHI